MSDRSDDEGKPQTLVGVSFDTVFRAQEFLRAAHGLAAAGHLKLVDAVTILKDDNGKAIVHETTDPGPGRSALTGAMWTGLLGLLLASRVETVEEGVGATSPADALRLANAAAPRGGLVVLVTDFRGPRDWRRPLAALAARHHVLAVEVDDPREAVLTDIGELTLVDAETGREVRVDTSSRRLRERFAEAAAGERASIAAELRRMGVDHIVLSTRGDWLRALAGELHVRGIRS